MENILLFPAFVAVVVICNLVYKATIESGKLNTRFWVVWLFAATSFAIWRLMCNWYFIQNQLPEFLRGYLVLAWFGATLFFCAFYLAYRLPMSGGLSVPKTLEASAIGAAAALGTGMIGSVAMLMFGFFAGILKDS
jgi:hypothetical protein